jgi:hypothetical protein
VISADLLIVASAAAGSCAVALLGWLLESRTSSRHASDRTPSTKWRRAATAFIVIGAAAAAIVAPIIAVLWVVVALNALLGGGENIPFSTYAMFSTPRKQTWILRFEDCDQHLIAIGKLGLEPHIAQKRFQTELRAARLRGSGDEAAARRTAASRLATLIDQRRPVAGPLATTPIVIVFVEYTAESGRLRTLRTPIGEATPR